MPLIRSAQRVLPLLASLVVIACQATPGTPAAGPNTPARTQPEAAQPAAAVQPTTAAAQTSSSGAAAQGDRIVISTPAWGVESSLPWRGGNQADWPLWNPVMETLTRLNPDTVKVEPYLADYSPSADYKSWTFTLHQGVMFHDGFGELTSEDVKYVFDRMLKPDATGGAAPILRATVDHVDAPDRYTVVVSMKSVDWRLPSNLVAMNILSKKQLDAQGEDTVSTHPSGTGPYKIADVRQGDAYTLSAAADAHWKWGQPHFKQMVIRRIGDPSTRIAALRTGEIDVAEVAGDYLDQVTATPGLRLVELPGILHYWVTLTGQTTPERDDYCPTCPWVGDDKDPASMDRALKVRQALALAIDKQAIVDGLWKGKGSLDPWSYGYTDNNDGFNPDWKLLPYDLTRARQLLAEAGVAGGFDVRLNPAVTPFTADNVDVTEAIAQDWEKLGLRVTEALEDMPTFIPKIRARNTRNTFSTYSPAPNDSPTVWWTTTAFPKAGFYFLQDRLYADNITAATAEPDPKKRALLERAIGDELDAGAYGVKVGAKAMSWAVSKKVGDWKPAKLALATNFVSMTWSGK